MEIVQTAARTSKKKIQDYASHYERKREKKCLCVVVVVVLLITTLKIGRAHA